MSLFSRVRTAAVTLFGLSLVVLTGCDSNSYPADMAYPLRSDPILQKTPKTEPKTTDRPGEMNQILKLYLGEEKPELLDPNGLTAEQRGALSSVLTKQFGTPASPLVADLSDEARKILQLQEATLQLGSRLYRQHCLHCHGLTGDGRGPTAAWVNPHPRDYRRGYFKFTSSTAPLGDQRRAHRYDLLRVLREGIEDTSMPSFRLLTDQELDALVSYVIHLSIRGQVEMATIRRAQLPSEESGETIEGNARRFLKLFTNSWLESQTTITPGAPVPLTRESVQQGMKLFLAKGEELKPGEPASSSVSCVSCHADFGRASTFRFDDWGTIIRPANLTRGVYRGGRRPIDLYWRIHGGINGSGMPSFAKASEDAKSGYSSEQIWSIVHFLQVLPYPEKHAEYGVNIDTTVASGEKR